MGITLIANGLTHRGEHSYRLVQEVGCALARRNMEYHVYASRSLDTAIVEEKVAIPHFRYSLYDSVGPRAPRFLDGTLERWWKDGGRALSYPAEFLTWRVLNHSFRNDLEALPPAQRAVGHLLVITAICQNQLSGVIDFMRAQAPETLPCVVCQLMFLPNWTPWECPAQFGDAYYRKALQRASPFIGRRLFFTTENESIAKVYCERYGIVAKILPVPFAVSPSSTGDGKVTRVGFFGYSKASKGFHLLPEAITLCQNAGLNVEFRVQVQHSRWERTTCEAERKLRGMSNVHLIEGVLGSNDYIAETNKADVVLLPYDPILFGTRGSGIFTESVSAGRPVIASDGTRAAESIRLGEAQGEVFAPYNAEELANAVIRIFPKISQLRAQAATQAKRFASKHTGDAYVDVLLSLMKAAPSRFAVKPTNAEDITQIAKLPALPSRKKVSVVTVCLNAAENLESTIKSVLEQDFSDREYIILDGSSTDGSIAIIEKYTERLAYWQSEPDQGVYYAMNKAVDHCAGKWILFMNAGDSFSAPDSLSRMLRYAPDDADIIYGHHLYVPVGGLSKYQAAADFEITWNRLQEGELWFDWLAGIPAHQATAVRRHLLHKLKFDTRFHVAADHDFLFRAYLENAKFFNCDEVVSIYSGGGLSAKNYALCKQEWAQIGHMYGNSAAVDRFYALLETEAHKWRNPWPYLQRWARQIIQSRYKLLFEPRLHSFKAQIVEENAAARAHNLRQP